MYGASRVWPETMEAWLERARGSRGMRSSKWRSQACRAMLTVVETYTGMWDYDPDAFLKLIDSAYPFGARENYPYKAWLAERRVLIAALRTPVVTWEQYDIIRIADDMLQVGRDKDALETLEQVPNRHTVSCATCGVRPGQPCRDPISEQATPQQLLFGVTKRTLHDLATEYKATPFSKYQNRLIPHEARILPKMPREESRSP